MLRTAGGGLARYGTACSQPGYSIGRCVCERCLSAVYRQRGIIGVHLGSSAVENACLAHSRHPQTCVGGRTIPRRCSTPTTNATIASVIASVSCAGIEATMPTRLWASSCCPPGDGRRRCPPIARRTASGTCHRSPQPMLPCTIVDARHAGLSAAA
jgi:hypothetical protein